jgi:hypothetical protein
MDMQGYFSPEDRKEIFILKPYKRGGEMVVYLVHARWRRFGGAKDQKFLLSHAVELLHVLRLR